jgi:predicted amidohydrolase
LHKMTSQYLVAQTAKYISETWIFHLLLLWMNHNYFISSIRTNNSQVGMISVGYCYKAWYPWWYANCYSANQSEIVRYSVLSKIVKSGEANRRPL